MLIDWTPLLQVALLGAAVAAVPLTWWHLRAAKGSAAARLRALTVLTAFLTFDLIAFGAFTRLTDSGLGCPDWPGCYGQASPVGAQAHIAAEQAARPTGPVTHGKAWVEMIHRYLAAGVGVLCIVLCVQNWRQRAGGVGRPGLAALTLGWVVLQGAFGALTVTMKLFPAIVSLHLLFGIGLLLLLVVQAEALQPRPLQASSALRAGLWVLLAAVVLQVSLGGWVSTNYAVLACDEFPSCRGGSLWPDADFAGGFTLWRELGTDGRGGLLSFAALIAIHLAHRVGAFVVLAGLVWAGLRLRREGLTRPAAWLWGLAAWQFLSGLSNVVLGWPLVAALAHTSGAAALLAVLVSLLARLHAGRRIRYA